MVSSMPSVAAEYRKESLDASCMKIEVLSEFVEPEQAYPAGPSEEHELHLPLSLGDSFGVA